MNGNLINVAVAEFTYNSTASNYNSIVTLTSNGKEIGKAQFICSGMQEAFFLCTYNHGESVGIASCDPTHIGNDVIDSTCILQKSLWHHHGISDETISILESWISENF